MLEVLTDPLRKILNFFLVYILHPQQNQNPPHRESDSIDEGHDRFNKKYLVYQKQSIFRGTLHFNL